MKTYKEMIKKLRDEWIGRTVQYRGNSYTVIDVDYNGALLIDKPTQYTDTMAIGINQIDKA